MSKRNFTTVADAWQLSPQHKPQSRRKAASVAHGARFGAWRFDAHAETLDFEPADRRLGSGWFIHLKQLRSQRGLRDALTYSMRKPYFDSEDVANFSWALRHLGLEPRAAQARVNVSTSERPQ